MPLRPLRPHHAALALIACLASAVPAPAQPEPPYWSTFSIIAVDPATGMAGIAIASSTWTEHASDILTPGISPGTGIIVSQAALLQRNYARGVELMKEGKSPQEVIETLKKEDPRFESRQIAVVDMSGRSAAFSGNETLAWAGSRGGPYFSAQGNILVNDRTVPAEAEAFVASAGQPLADRLMAALVAGSRAGGDARGKQFATLQVMRKGPDGTPVNDVVFDIADSPDPVAELDRLFRIHKVSLDLNRIGELRRAGKIRDAIDLGEAALARLPEGHRRQPFESVSTALAVLYYQAGDMQKARAHLKNGAAALPIHRRLFEQRARTDDVAKRMLADADLVRDVYER
ncbi:MAG TPA: DUF1028 domain-containing protein [Vicinamibacterales bacterium]|jgi:uncharacterized Ntn-hydrolase superfamily protein|nr:DUF1028 domain-containing protein [Vicinamibacterales bacterium]